MKTGTAGSNGIIRALAGAILFCALASPNPVESGCGPLPPPGPGEAVVQVSDTAGLLNAVDSASGPTTIYLENGTYSISGNGVVVSRPSVTIRSLSGNRDDVVIRGGGMNSGDTYFGVYINASGFTLADLTVRDVRYHGVFIDPSSSPSGFLFHNIRVVDCGEQLFKASGGRDTGSKSDGIIECSAFEYITTLGEGDYTNGIDLLNSHNWIIRDNVIGNIKAGPGGDLAGPAILVWQGSSGTVVERNRVLDCDMGISFGNSYDSAPSHTGGVIRNNFVKGYANSDFGICVSKSPDVKVINNTIYSPGSWPYSIEVQYASSSNCLLVNNLSDEPFWINRFETNNPQLVTNLTAAGPEYFTDPGSGDLHLRSSDLPAIDSGTFTPDREMDIDGQGSIGLAPDIGADERRTPAVLQSGDYSGDGTAGIAFFRPATGLWAVRGLTRVYFGSPSDQPVPADYDGDGTDDFAVFRESSGLWAARGITRNYFGRRGDIPAPGDYNGDGTAQPAVFRPGSGLWAIRGTSRIYFGSSADIPVPGYYGGPAARPAVFRPASGLWAVRGVTRTYFGSSGDIPVPGNFAGSGSWTPAIFRPATGLWAVRGGSRLYFGAAADRAVPGDYQGGGIDLPAIFRPTSGLWAIRGLTRIYFGGSSDWAVSR
ncbi:MAG: right-handed parallel beta-helix repeat-containing protein [Candidatus Erginobacter occultus]|nr:right-handed parallel beta-helix repeat-containing protein [Candidatus Erginobacter occultus]